MYVVYVNGCFLDVHYLEQYAVYGCFVDVHYLQQYFVCMLYMVVSYMSIILSSI